LATANGKKTMTIMLSRFHTIPACHGRTDGRTDRRTDRITISISRVSSSMLTRDNNQMHNEKQKQKGRQNTNGCYYDMFYQKKNIFAMRVANGPPRVLNLKIEKHQASLK